VLVCFPQWERPSKEASSRRPALIYGWPSRRIAGAGGGGREVAVLGADLLGAAVTPPVRTHLFITSLSAPRCAANC